MFRSSKILKVVTRIAYLSGLVMLLSGMILSIINQPVQAARKIPTPTMRASDMPTVVPTKQPTMELTDLPTMAPTVVETNIPTQDPGITPTQQPTKPPKGIPIGTPIGPRPDIHPSRQLPTGLPDFSLRLPFNRNWLMLDPYHTAILNFSSGCLGDCNQAQTTVCNTGNVDMTSSTTWELYFSATNDAANRTQVNGAGGSIGPLNVGQCQQLTAPASMGLGSYWFKAYQEASYPGQPEVWSGGCLVDGTCQVTPPAFENLTIEYTCSFVGSTTYDFLVYNPNGFPVAYTWSSTNGASGSSFVAGHNGDFIHTAAGPQTVSIYVDGVLQGSAHSRDDIPFCKQDIDIKFVCTDDGNINWTVTNPSDYGFPYSYTIDGGSPVYGTIGPNGTVLITTTAGAHTLVFSIFVHGTTRTYSLSSPPDTCVEIPPQDLTIDQVCEDTDVVFQIHNPNAFDASISYTLDNVTTSGVTVPAGGSYSIRAIVGVAHDLTVTWVYQGVTRTYTAHSAADDCGTTPVPQNLALDYACSADNTAIEWSVFNPNNYAVNFHWVNTANSDNGDDQVGAGQTKMFYSSSLGANSVTVSWTNPNGSSGSTSRANPATLCENVQQPQDLTLAHACVDDGIVWTITNPNNFDADVTYTLDNAVPVNLTVPANSSSTIHTSIGVHTLHVTWHYGDWTGNYVDQSTFEECAVTPPVNLTLDYVCELNSHINWIVSNPSSSPVSFDWNWVDGSKKGTATAPANGKVLILTTPIGAHTVEITWETTPGVDKKIGVSSGVDSCKQGGGGTPTPTPKGNVTGTPAGTLPPTVSAPGGKGGAVLIPVTGADLTNNSLSALQQMFINLGLITLGVAFTLQGIQRRVEKHRS